MRPLHKIQLIIGMMIFFSTSGCKRDIIDPAGQSPKKDPPPATKPIVYPDFSNLGYPTNITLEYAAVSSLGAPVLDMRSIFNADSGRVIITILSNQGTEIISGENVVDYAKSLSGKLKVSTGLGLFKSSVSYFDSLAFRSDYIYSSYNLLVKHKRIRINASAEWLRNHLTSQFKSDIATQSPSDLVRHFGTHVVTDLITGGKFVALYRARTSSTDRRSAASAGLSGAIKKLFDFDISGGANSSYATTNSDQLLYYFAAGGYSNISLVGEKVELGSTVPKTVQIGTWQNSVTSTNAVMIEFGSSDLIPLYDLVADPAKSTPLKAYIDKYLINNQVKMIDPPPAVYVYYDSGNTNWAYSLDNVPTLYQRLLRQGPAFRAYAKQTDLATAITQYYNNSNGDFIYSKNPNANLSGYTNMGTTFYAYDKQIPGTVPVFEFLYNAKINKRWYFGHFYSTTNALPGTKDWQFTGIAFYAYPL